MKRWIGLIVGLLMWCATGVFVVQGDQQAAVRRFGRFVSEPSTGELKLFGSGLHWDWPYPFSQVDRVNLNELRSLELAPTEVRMTPEEEQFNNVLMEANSSLETQFLTGDKNVLHIRLSVHYRIDRQQLRQFLTSDASPHLRLHRFVEAAAADLIARSGVDFVHPLGVGRLQTRLTETVRQHAVRFGLAVDTVSIDQVEPPIRVKAEFLDVANAQADRDRFIQTATSYAEQQSATANSAAQQLLDASESDRHQMVESARGKSQTVMQMLDQIAAADDPKVTRQLVMRRLYVETMEDVLQSVASKVFLGSDESIDLMMFQKPDSSSAIEKVVPERN